MKTISHDLSIVKYHCDYCQEDIDDIRVKCAECGDFDLCLQCFICGAEIGNHSRKHNYQLIVEGTKKEDVETFFKHLDSAVATSGKERVILVGDFNGRVGNEIHIYGQILQKFEEKGKPNNNGKLTEDAFCLEGEMFSSIKEVLSVDKLNKRIERPNFQDCGNIPVFQPPNAWKSKEEMLLLDTIERLGFDNWEDIAKHNDKTEEEVKEHYNNMYILGAVGQATWSQPTRPQIKDHTTMETGLLSPTCIPPSITDLSQENQELGYMPQRDDFEREYDNEAESLICNLVIGNEDDDTEIALKLAQIDMYSRRVKERFRRKKVTREHGLVNIFHSSCNKQKSVISKKKTSKDEKEFQEKMKTFCQFHLASDNEKLFENMQKEKDIKSKIKELMRYRRNGLTKMEDRSEYDTARYKREKKKENKKKSGNCSSAHRRSNVSKKQEDKAGNDVSSEEQGENDIKEETKEMDVSSQPSYDLLSEREKKLCSSLGLKPLYYITFKTVLLKDHLERRHGNSVKHRYPADLDKSHRRKIINFMVNSGWITAC